LLDAGLEMAPTGSARGDLESLYLYNAITRAEERVCIFYHLFAGDRAYPAYWVEALREQLPPSVFRKSTPALSAPHPTLRLVSETLSLTCTADETGDVDEFKSGGNDPSGVFKFGKHIKTLIRHRNDSGVGFDGAEGEVRRFSTAFAQGVEERGFANVGQTDKTAGKTHNIKNPELKMLLPRPIGCGSSGYQ
jgi:hypothetical protein